MATAYGPDTRDQHRPGTGAGATHAAKHFFPAALRAPFEARTWRELAYLLLSLPISVVLFSFAITMVSLGLGMLITFLGIPILAMRPRHVPRLRHRGAGPGARAAEAGRR